MGLHLYSYQTGVLRTIPRYNDPVKFIPIRGEMTAVQYTIGVDFDNTIAGYDDLIFKVAFEKGLIKSNIQKSKKVIRDAIRLLPDGEIEWQKIQAEIYGPRMDDAELIEGVKEFFQNCRGHKIYVISHKTEFANLDISGINLRKSAMKWMELNGFFDRDGMGLVPKNVFFEPTRQRKIQRIVDMECTHFIDDLEETFNEHSFPKKVEKILFVPHGNNSSRTSHLTFKNWKEINHYFFDRKS